MVEGAQTTGCPRARLQARGGDAAARPCPHACAHTRGRGHPHAGPLGPLPGAPCPGAGPCRGQSWVAPVPADTPKLSSGPDRSRVGKLRPTLLAGPTSAAARAPPQGPEGICAGMLCPLSAAQNLPNLFTPDWGRASRGWDWGAGRGQVIGHPHLPSPPWSSGGADGARPAGEGIGGRAHRGARTAPSTTQGSGQDPCSRPFLWGQTPPLGMPASRQNHFHRLRGTRDAVHRRRRDTGSLGRSVREREHGASVCGAGRLLGPPA